MSLMESIHDNYVVTRRARVLSRHVAALLPPGARVLDVGSGDGLLAALVARQRPDVVIQGIDVLVRPITHIPVAAFDGVELPFETGSFDAVTMVDVLHHTEVPLEVLREAARVANEAVVLKDHLLQGFLARRTLRLMDRVSNARHGIDLPYNYWTLQSWQNAFAELKLGVDIWQEALDLYRWPANLVFGRRLHFVARLRVPPVRFAGHE
jgi:SAM-dependent methyltransferase